MSFVQPPVVNNSDKKQESTFLLGATDNQKAMNQPFWTVQESPWEIFKRILLLSSLMIFLPLGLYLFSKAVVFEMFLGMSTANSYFYAAIVAIVAAHVVLVAFIFIALSDGTEPPKRKLH